MELNAGAIATLRRRSPTRAAAWLIGLIGMLAVGATAPAAAVVPPTTVDLSGPQGGPFPSGSTLVPLFNPENRTILWRARQANNWAQFSATSGALPAGGTGSVQVSINHAVANLLPLGTYDAFLFYRAAAAQPYGILAHVRLTVEPNSGPDQTMNTASRTSGVAPFSVFFDAVGSGTGVTQPTGTTPDWASMHYRWSFDDPNAGMWTHNGKSKNTAHGYVAAHVFETPGTYRVTLQVTEPGGDLLNYHQDITVTNPDTAYAGQTYYVSATGSDSNTGTSPTSPFRTVTRGTSTLFASNGPRRLLFKRGEAWTASSTITASGRTGPFTIGAYGTGTNPVLNVTHSGDGIRFDTSVRDVRIVDLDVAGPYPATNGEGVQLGRDSLLLRSTVRGFRLGVGGHATNCIGNTIAECAIVDNGDYGMYYSAGMSGGGDNDPPIHLAVIGNRFDNAIHNSLLRTYVSRSLWQGNLFQRAGQSATRVMGLHTPKKAEFVIIADNRFTSLTAWVLEIGPENSENGGSGGTPQNVENVIVEGNKFSLAAPGAVSRFVLVWGRHITVRNNIFDHTTASWGGSILVARRGIGPIPVGVSIDNNTAYRATASGGPWQFVDAASADMTLVRNNIVYSPLSSVTVATGTVSAQGNMTANPLFQNPNTGDFRLQVGSPAIDHGVLLPLRIDYLGNVRPVTAGVYDVGAHERL